MGSLCTSGPTTTNTVGASTTTPTGLPQLNDIWNRVSSAASTPYTPYGGQLVADLNPVQQAGISTINGAAGSAQPYYDMATQYGKAGAASINPNDISKYISPYTQNVIDATQRNFNESNAQQQQQVQGNAALQGALGGDRVKVAQAETARQQKLAQDPTIAGLYSNAYTQALGAAQADRAAQAQGAFTFGSLAPAIQNSGIQGGQAQIGAGSVAQGTDQAKLSAQYQQYLQALAFPYQQAQFLTSAGLPAVGAMGGTSNTAGRSQTYPSQPSILGQVAGLGVAGAGAYNMFGGSGSGGYATSVPNSPGAAMYTGDPTQAGFGPTYSFSSGGRVGMSRGGRARRGSRPHFADGGFIGQVHAIRQALRGGGHYADGGGVGGSVGGPEDLVYPDDSPSFIPHSNPMSLPRSTAVQYAPTPTMQQPGAPAAAQNPMAGIGTIASAAARFLPMLALNRGGRVGYADGGDVVDTFDDRFPYAGAINSGADAMADPIAARNALIALGKQSPFALSGDVPGAPTPGIPLPSPQPAQVASSPYSLPPEITNPGGGGQPITVPENAMAYDGAQPPAGAPPMSPFGSAATSPSPMGRDASAGTGTGALGLSNDASLGLISAGLGIMASRGPNALAQIGEGGLAGVKTYAEAKNTRQRNELEARKIIQQAEQFSQTLGLHKEQFGLQKEQFGETKQQHLIDNALKTRTPVKIGEMRNGTPIMALPKITPTGEVSFYRLNQDGTISDTPIGSTPSAVPSKPTQDSATPEAPPPEVRASAPPASAQARDDGYLSEIAKEDPKYAALLKSVANYQVSPNSLFSVRNNRKEKALGDLMTYDPTYDQRRYNQTNKAITGWAQSPEGRATRSLSVTIEHLGTAEELGKALESGDMQILNRLKNTFKTQFGYEGPPSFEFAKQIVADEIAKAVIGGQNGEKDRQGLQQQLSSASSPQQLAGVIRTAKQLMGGQVIGLKHTYETASGLHNFDDWLTPRAREEIAKITVHPSSSGNQGGGAGAAKPPTVTQNGHTYTLQPDGSYK